MAPFQEDRCQSSMQHRKVEKRNTADCVYVLGKQQRVQTLPSKALQYGTPAEQGCRCNKCVMLDWSCHVNATVALLALEDYWLICESHVGCGQGSVVC
jgi:hypothetical protein